MLLVEPISPFSKCAVSLGFVVHGPPSGFKIWFQKADIKKDRTRSRSKAKTSLFFHDHPTAAGATRDVRQASAQEAGSSAQQRETAGNGYAYLHLAVEYHDVLAFLPHFLL